MSVFSTVEFNGTSWSAGGSMTRPAGQSFPGFGTEPSGGIAGGYKTSGNAVVNNFESSFEISMRRTFPFFFFLPLLLFLKFSYRNVNFHMKKTKGE